MKVLFTGGGTRGHFYPIIAVAEQINKLAEDEKFFDIELFYMADQPFDERLLFDNGITFKKTATGKMRRYFSFKNIADIFRTGIAVIKAIGQLYKLYPDVVVGKGGYASFPALFAARFLRIPVIIHESDSVPGAVNKWAGKFADKIAISYPSAAKYFPKERTALTGNPIRSVLLNPTTEGAKELLNLEDNVPVIFIVGGSQGAQIINGAVMQILPELVGRYQIIHQTGANNIDEVRSTANALLKDSEHAGRYKPFAFLDDLALRMTAGVTDLVISRAGSTIFEIAVWGLPSIIIPITESNGDHQRTNAYTYARAGACEVIEEKNFTPHLLLSEVNRLIDTPEERSTMSQNAQQFARVDAAEKIAREIISILHEHEK